MGTPFDLARSLLDPDRSTIPQTGMQASYRAGQVSRSMHGFNPSNVGPNVANESSLRLSRARIRSLMLDNPIIGGAQDVIRDNVVGLGIRPMPNTEWPDLNKQLEALLEDAENGVDPERVLTLGQSQGQFFDELFSAGDCGCYYPLAEPFRGKPLSPAVELIDSDRIDIEQTGPVGSEQEGHLVRQGVELDSRRRVVGYHVLREHPFDGFLSSLDSLRHQHDRLTIDDMHLGMVPRRIKMLRGVPWPVRVVRTGKLEDQYHEANLLLMQAAASIGLIVKGGAGQGIAAVGDSSGLRDSAGNPITQLSPGMIGHTHKDADVTLVNPNAGAAQVAEMTSMLLRRIAAGLNVSYSALARDYARSSFAAQRAEQLQDRRGYRRLQRVLWWQGPGYGWYWRQLRFWIVTGQIKLTAEQKRAFVEMPERIYRHSVIAPGWEWVDPLREAQAEAIALENNTTSQQRLTAAKGERWKDIVREQLDAEQFEDDERERRGMKPRDRTQAVAVAAAGAGGKDDSEDDNDDEKGDDE